MKNDFLTLIRTRRSIRAYRPDAVPADVLARVLEAGTYAPSAMGAPVSYTHLRAHET